MQPDERPRPASAARYFLAALGYLTIAIQPLQLAATAAEWAFSAIPYLVTILATVAVSAYVAATYYYGLRFTIIIQMPTGSTQTWTPTFGSLDFAQPQLPAVVQ